VRDSQVTRERPNLHRATFAGKHILWRTHEGVARLSV